MYRWLHAKLYCKCFWKFVVFIIWQYLSCNLYRTLCYEIGASDTTNKNTSNSEEIDDNETNDSTVDQHIEDDTGIVSDIM